ncbi:DUF6286 domain-containing protein [Streptomyces sp. NPDC048550]|uniref:DUF6286 domain-containing protein n=1 Tax=unclassified Streptomyces TaxID=2593676 RepID=UPI000AC8885F|nr:DUF6286 domain-containing protein [Streptomyces sp. NBC_00320]MCX5148455.1 DUF6286 domain-containing protein [Streptomyces sp. NBC_00320]
MTAPAPGRAPVPDPAPDPGRAPVRVARFRSARRIPAALTALAVLGVAGLFLYDLAAVRAGRPGMEWRRELAHQLERQTPADPWVLVCAGVLALAGAVLLFLALAPGLRRILPMRTADPDAGVRAGLGRKAAAQVLRDRAMEVSGVQSARVAVGRSRVAVRAASHFRGLDDVRADLESVLEVGIGELGLAHPPQLRVRVTRAAVGKG